jgi:myo-inositol-1(or 4)-monophosphatase
MGSYLETAREIAQEAGALLLGYFDRGVGYKLKGEFDLVTEADHASEALIVERLRSHFPGHGIMAEEGGGADSGSRYCWYIDPLDGTTNFAHGFPAFCVSIALAEDGNVVCGVIYDPLHQELFEAERGSGAWLNGRRIRVSERERLADSLLATGFPSRKRHLNVNVHFYYQVAMVSHGVRRAGSAALDLAYVACGRLDGYWEFGLNPWDMAAGILLVEEAGGKVTDMHGGPATLKSPHVMADNGRVHEELLELFREIFAGRFRTPLPTIGGQ